MTREVDITISAMRPDSPAGRELITQLDADLLERYPANAIHGLHPEDIDDSNLLFLVATIEGRPVGCGALRPLDEPHVAEFKRMFTIAEQRGRGIARRLLAALERAAQERGYTVVRLETGIRQPEALGLYRSAGYREIECFGEYANNPFSVCFEKRIDARL